jgi:hypothetical protein
MSPRRTAPSTAMTWAGIGAALATSWFTVLVVRLAVQVLA